MTQTLNYTLPKLLSVVLGVSVLLGATHVKDVSALTFPPAATFSDGKQKDVNSPNQNSYYKVNVDHHNHIDKQSLKSVIKQVNNQTPQADLKSVQRHRHGVPKKVSKKQKYSDSWHTLLHQIA